MSKIKGICGVFLKLDTDTKKLLKWYKDVLELDVSEYGINFLEPNQLTLITFDRKADDEAKLNFTVDDLEAYIIKIEAKGVKIHKQIETYPFGKFAQIIDEAGNIIELCQLDEKKYSEMVRKEIEAFDK